MFDHPGVQYVCRHCGKNAGYDPELCYECGPLCDDCFCSDDPLSCPAERKRSAAKRRLES